jgi:pyrrolysine biosynthesis protein PylC
VKGPFIVKPDSLSGGRGVRRFENRLEILEAFPRPEDLQGAIIEKFAEGELYSVEVTAVGGRAKSHQVTKLLKDDDYDCRTVMAPSGLDRAHEKEFKRMAELLAKRLSLTGIMDLEGMFLDGKFNLLEIDARFPSQTPITVHWSTGVNLLVETAACFIDLPPRPRPARRLREVVYEQYLFSGGRHIPSGERVFSKLGPVTVRPGFMGSDEALVSGDVKGGHFTAAFIRAKRPAASSPRAKPGGPGGPGR